MIDSVCRKVKQNQGPFGGIQIILVGDFFQLPPVVRTGTRNNPRLAPAEKLTARFAYSSPAWEQANLVVCYLSEQYRQDDGAFLDLLAAIRRGSFDNNHLRHIRSRKIHPASAPKDAPKLFSHNVDVDRVNSQILASLPSEPKEFSMSSQGPRTLVATLMRGCLSPETLYLKTGAAVMFTKNNPKESFVNGTLGIVESFDKHAGQPIVKTRSGWRIAVKPMDWTVEENGVVRARISQLPLRLAWAITVHKSQGMSLDEAVMDLSEFLNTAKAMWPYRACGGWPAYIFWVGTSERFWSIPKYWPATPDSVTIQSKPYLDFRRQRLKLRPCTNNLFYAPAVKSGRKYIPWHRNLPLPQARPVNRLWR